MKFVILSDTHVVTRGETAKSLDTGERLQRAIVDLNTHHADAAFCVLTGDLVDHGQRDAYVYLRLEQERLRVVDPATGDRLMTPTEAQEARRAEAAARRAELAHLQDETS